jgi:hypothetical protein
MGILKRVKLQNSKKPRKTASEHPSQGRNGAIFTPVQVYWPFWVTTWMEKNSPQTSDSRKTICIPSSSSFLQNSKA